MFDDFDAGEALLTPEQRKELAKLQARFSAVVLAIVGAVGLIIAYVG